MFFKGVPCRKCGNVIRFTRDKKCIECVRLRDRTRNKTELRKARDKERSKLIHRREKVKEWCKTNPDKKRHSDQSWRERHPEKVRATSSRQYYRNPAKARAAVISWALRNPKKAKAAKQKSDRAKRARKCNAAGSHTPNEVLQLLHRQGGQCFYCAISLFTFHEDHFIPLSRGGSHDIANIKLSCGPCNLKKAAKMPRDFFVQLWNDL